MREIKFRAWDNLQKKYEYWDAKNDKYDGIFWSMVLRPEFEEPEQFTGLKDKDGEDLDWWEGDIILAITEILHIIVFDNGAFYLEENGGGRWLGNEAAQWDISCRKKVGNIHTNSELLEHQS